MYLSINDVPQTKDYTLEDNAMFYYALLHAIKVHKYDYEINVPDCDYTTYCSEFIRGLDSHIYLWLRDVDYASYDHCEDKDSYLITWAIDCLIAYEKKADLDRDLERKYKAEAYAFSEDLPF